MVSIDLNSSRHLSQHASTERVINFVKKFGEGHLHLASHAAFPLIITPDLLYQIWANFVPDAPWTAVADVLLSQLCSEIGHELYGFDIEVRQILLRDLSDDENYGLERIKTLSVFLEQYSYQQLLSKDTQVREFAQMNHWVALSYNAPDIAAKEIASYLSSIVQKTDLNHDIEGKAEILRVTPLIDTLKEPLKDYEPLFIYARGLNRLVIQEQEAAKESFDLLGGISLSSVNPLDLVIPDLINQTSKGHKKKSKPLEQVVITNPYFVGMPLKENSFILHKNIIDWAQKEILSGHKSLVIYGPRRSGITTILFQINNQLKLAHHLPIYVDLMTFKFTSLNDLLFNLADQIVEIANVRISRSTVVDRTGDSFIHQFLPTLYTVISKEARPVFIFDEVELINIVNEKSDDEISVKRAFIKFLGKLMLEDKRPKFIFGIHGHQQDLSNDLLSLLKGSASKRVGKLLREEAVVIIKQAEDNGTLHFTEEAIERIISLAGSTPIFIQLLCSVIWENAHKETQLETPIVGSFVEEVIPETLEKSNNIMNWLWTSLTPPEKIILSLSAPVFSKSKYFSKTEIEENYIKVMPTKAKLIYFQNFWEGIQYLVRDNIFEADNTANYTFSVELFQKWVMANKPIQSIKDVFDQIVPEAETIFQEGLSFYESKEPDKAISLFRKALANNPNHFGARVYLGEALISQTKFDEAIKILEEAYKLDSQAAAPVLLRAIIQYVNNLINADDLLSAIGFCKRGLDISPESETLKELKKNSLVKKAEEYVLLSDYEAAIKAYEEAGELEKGHLIKEKRKKRSGFSLFSQRRILCPYCLTENVYKEKLKTCMRCKREIPPLYLDSYNTHLPVFFPIYGLSGEGKTVYLLALYNSFNKLNAFWPRFFYKHLENTSYVSHYLNNLFIKGKFPEATFDTHTYLVSLSNMPRWGDRTLVATDSRGEFSRLSNQREDINISLKYKPVTIFAVSTKNLLDKSKSVLYDLTTNYVNMVKKYKNDKNSYRRSIIVVITKPNETVQELSPLLSDYLLSDPFSLHEKNLDASAFMERYITEMKRIDAFIKDWLQSFVFGRNVINLTGSNNINIYFSIVSSLGNNRKDLSNVSSYRVLDPLFWALDLQSVP